MENIHNRKQTAKTRSELWFPYPWERRMAVKSRLHSHDQIGESHMKSVLVAGVFHSEHFDRLRPHLGRCQTVPGGREMDWRTKLG
jgi:hypothetical protein